MLLIAVILPHVRADENLLGRELRPAGSKVSQPATWHADVVFLWPAMLWRACLWSRHGWRLHAVHDTLSFIKDGWKFINFSEIKRNSELICQLPYERTHCKDLWLGMMMAQTELNAYKLEILVEAACRYALVMELLTIIHDMRNGRPIDFAESELLNAASFAAPLARAERLNQGIDCE
jgi:hypothetical protein